MEIIVCYFVCCSCFNVSCLAWNEDVVDPLIARQIRHMFALLCVLLASKTG